MSDELHNANQAKIFVPHRDSFQAKQAREVSGMINSASARIRELEQNLAASEQARVELTAQLAACIGQMSKFPKLRERFATYGIISGVVRQELLDALDFNISSLPARAVAIHAVYEAAKVWKEGIIDSGHEVCVAPSHPAGILFAALAAVDAVEKGQA